MARSGRFLHRFVCALLIACGTGDSDDSGDDAGPSDAALDDSGSSFQPSSPEPPVAPTLPEWSCPDGWRRVADPEEPDISVCDPWPEGGPQDCADDEAHFPGERSCSPIGPPCPEGPFADDLPADGVIYVEAGARKGGDGSALRPFAAIEEALDAASGLDETVIALSKGTFTQSRLYISRPVRLWGACTAQTIVASNSPNSGSAAVELASSARGLKALTITGQRGGVLVSAPADVELEGVVIRDVAAFGLAVRGGLRASEVLVRDVPENFIGLDVAGAAHAVVSRVAVERGGTVGVFVEGIGSDLLAEDLVVRGGAPGENGPLGPGLEVVDGAQAELTRTALFSNHGHAIGAIAASVVARDLHVSRTFSEDGVDGQSLRVAEGSTLVEGAVFEAGASIGIFAAWPGTDLTLRSVVVRDIAVEEGTGAFGYGVLAQDGTNLVMDRVAVLSATQAGVVARDESTALEATDLSVRATRDREADGYGAGLVVDLGARVRLQRAAMLRNAGSGIWVDEASLEGTDWTVDENRVVGMLVANGSFVTVERLALTENRAQGLLVVSGEHLIGGTGSVAMLDASDVAIIDTRSIEVDGVTGLRGIGLNIGGGAISIRRGLVRGNREVGILVMYPESQVDLQDVLIDQTKAQDCAETTCRETGAGMGITTAREGQLSLQRFRISHNALCGLQIADGALVTLAEGEISDNPIGANVQDEGYDLDLLSNDVRYVDNDVNMNDAPLPVPTLPEGF